LKKRGISSEREVTEKPSHKNHKGGYDILTKSGLMKRKALFKIAAQARTDI
jgi:hypothetical protein